jgi:undecaprenyl-diphosphatase
VDADAVVWLATHRTAWLDAVMVALTVCGYAGVVWIAIGAVAARVRGAGRWRAALRVAAVVWAADLLTLLVKSLVDRPRPFEVLQQVEPLLGGTVGASFPSGHAATSAAGAVTVALAAPRLVPALAVLAAAICLSRVYGGVHYPTDIAGGLALGVAVAGAAEAGRRVLASRRGGDAAVRATARTATGSGPRSSASGSRRRTRARR